IGGAATAIGELAKLRYLERLATRLPDATLARHAAFLRWSLPGAIGLKVILTNATLVLGSFAAAAAHAPSSALSRMTCFFGVAELAALLLLLVYLHLQYQLMRAFCRQAQWARATWATGSGNQGGAANVTAEPSGE
ncbi:MAG: hypothetical protein KKB50_05045, partial [Planctomycetes bacterium]|nr:hypothetical protein [Planctomycetota bacterium]